jgi:TatD DNase family protein
VPTYIDTHAHLYSKKFDQDRKEMVRRAIAAGVNRLYLPNIDEESTAAMLQLEEDFPDHCFAMMGLHPCSVTEQVDKDLAWVEYWLGERKWAGIGETGIDLYWDKTWIEQQKKAFAQQIEWAKDLNRPVIVHARESNEVCLEVVREGQDGRLRGIFHCFSGTLEQAKEMIDLGFILGIGGTVTYPKSELPAVLKHIDLKHLVLETDAPYLPPVPHRGKRNESSYIPVIAEMVSEIKVVPVAEVARRTTENALAMFGS